MATVEMTDKKTDQKQKALDTALTQIERSYGKGAIMRMGEDGAPTAIEAIPTGALNLDAAIGMSVVNTLPVLKPVSATQPLPRLST